MQKRVLSSAIALALTALASGTALAQSSVTIYGNIDVSVDRVKKDAGTRLLPEAGALVTANNQLSNKVSTTRVGPDLSSQSALGFRGTEDLGGGYKGNFVLEGQMGVDNGALLRDSRLFGRQAYAGLTTPFGEVRLGRQYAPIFFSSAVITTERFGGTDQFIEGGLSNNLNIRWDNALTYSLQMGGFRGQLGFSPNAGVADIVNFNRTTTPTAGSDSNGSVLGGNNSGASGEKTSGRGRSWGAFGAYALDALTVSAGYSSTDFKGVPVNLLTGTGTSYGLATPLFMFNLGDYSVWNLGAKYALKELGLTLTGAFGRATYDVTNASPTAGLFGVTSGDLEVSSLVLGARYEIGAVAFLGQWSETKFRNEGRGKNHGITLGAEYSLSKRTTVYTRWAQLRDKGIGPAVVFPATGIREVPPMGGAGITPDGKSSLLALGVRHNF